MKSIGAEFLRPDALPGVNHLRGMHFQRGLNIRQFSHFLEID